ARRGGVRAGDRAPDAALRDDGGATPRLFDLLRSQAHTLLLLSPDPTAAGVGATLAARYGELLQVALVPRAGVPAPASPLPSLHDVSGALHRAYGATGPTAVLIRPDTYVGYLGAPTGVAEYLAGYLM
ncbi:MAG: hypothetical protein SF182_04510, partial [Deltaproteobacteria bacterium]|nr:hypothetical protein [Deltaproteobacteria bacterium]